MNSNLKGNGGTHETSREKDPAIYLVFCPCGEMSLLEPIHTCNQCADGVHHTFECPICHVQWFEDGRDLVPV